MTRRYSRRVNAGGVAIGDGSPVTVQSMTNTDTMDAAATLDAVKKLADAGCDIVRIALPEREAAKTVYSIKNSGINIPIVADIHFDYRIALDAVAAGIDKIRINPGNIGSDEHVKAVADACRKKGIPIRIGVNSGSLEKHILAKYGAPTAQALAESALYHASLLEKFDFYDIVLSVKSSSVMTTIEANRILAEKCDYPLHIGVTEAGGEKRGSIKGAIGIGTLLSEGIGDTIRVSLTADPVSEVKAGYEILDCLGLSRKKRLNIISCPTCGRTKIDIISLVSEFEKEAELAGLSDIPATVAIMGCIVNGPGEAREADIGIAGGIGEGILFRRGEMIRRISEDRIIPELIDELKLLRSK